MIIWGFMWTLNYNYLANVTITMCESPQKPLFKAVCVFPNWGDVDCGGCHKVSVGLPPVPASPRHNPSTCSPNSGENSLRKLFWSRSLFGIPSNWPFEEWVETHTFRLSLDPWPCSHCWGQMTSSLTIYKKLSYIKPVPVVHRKVFIGERYIQFNFLNFPPTKSPIQPIHLLYTMLPASWMPLFCPLSSVCSFFLLFLLTRQAGILKAIVKVKLWIF